VKIKTYFSWWVFDCDYQEAWFMLKSLNAHETWSPFILKSCKQIKGVVRAALLWSSPGGTYSLATPLRLQVGQNRHFPLPGNCDYEPKYSRKLDVCFYLSLWHPISTTVRFVVLVSYSGGLAFHSCMLIRLQRQVAKLASRFFYCWSFLCKNNKATNLLIFSSSYDIRRFTGCDRWTQTYWQVRQRGSDSW